MGNCAHSAITLYHLFIGIIHQVCKKSHISKISNSVTRYGEKHISQGLVTLLHICKVIPTPQLPIYRRKLGVRHRLGRTPKNCRDEHQCCSTERRRCHIERRYCRIERRVLQDVLCFTSGSRCFQMFCACVLMFYKCFIKFNNV